MLYYFRYRNLAYQIDMTKEVDTRVCVFGAPIEYKDHYNIYWDWVSESLPFPEFRITMGARPDDPNALDEWLGAPHHNSSPRVFVSNTEWEELPCSTDPTTVADLIKERHLEDLHDAILVEARKLLARQIMYGTTSFFNLGIWVEYNFDPEFVTKKQDHFVFKDGRDMAFVSEAEAEAYLRNNGYSFNKEGDYWSKDHYLYVGEVSAPKFYIRPLTSS
jgi:hypothetical protein